jgi:hypothetical protein
MLLFWAKSLVAQGFCQVLLIVARRSNCSPSCAADWLLPPPMALPISAVH